MSALIILTLSSIHSMWTDSDLVIAQDLYNGNKVHSWYNLIGQILYITTFTVVIVTLYNLLTWYYWSVCYDNFNLLSIHSMWTDSDLVIPQDLYKGNTVHFWYSLIGQIYITTYTVVIVTLYNLLTWYYWSVCFDNFNFIIYSLYVNW